MFVNNVRNMKIILAFCIQMWYIVYMNLTTNQETKMNSMSDVIKSRYDEMSEEGKAYYDELSETMSDVEIADMMCDGSQLGGIEQELSEEVYNFVTMR